MVLVRILAGDTATETPLTSETKMGRALPIPAQWCRPGRPGGVKASVSALRSAERPANPRKRREVWIVYDDNIAVGAQYKYLPGE